MFVHTRIPLSTQLAEAIDRAGADEAVTCLVLTGKGDYFSSGADLTDDSWSPCKCSGSGCSAVMHSINHRLAIAIAVAQLYKPEHLSISLVV
jgi:enoyl-CoA hydratase/carnithine racemase